MEPNVTNIAITADGVTLTMADGTMKVASFSAAPVVTQTVEVHTGDIIEVKGV